MRYRLETFSAHLVVSERVQVHVLTATDDVGTSGEHVLHGGHRQPHQEVDHGFPPGKTKCRADGQDKIARGDVYYDIGVVLFYVVVCIFYLLRAHALASSCGPPPNQKKTDPSERW